VSSRSSTLPNAWAAEPEPERGLRRRRHRSQGSRGGLLIDAVSDITIMTDEMRQTTSDTGNAVSREYIEDLTMRDDRITSILSVQAIMPKDTAAEAAFAAA
jgi:chemotaxis signal transduction protein